MLLSAARNACRSAARRPVASALTRSFSSLQDEYGEMNSDGLVFTIPSVNLDCGETLKDVDVCYKTWGTLNADKSNTVVVSHALTGNCSLDSWWGGLLGPGKPFDTDKYFVVCANVLGSCYGSCGPLSHNPSTKRPYGGEFPTVTIRDTVKCHAKLLSDGLGITDVLCAVGGSMGGMQTLEWLWAEDVRVRSAVPIACGGRHTPWQIGMSELQRQAIYSDLNWQGGYYTAESRPDRGLKVARMIAMLSYRTHHSYQTKFGRKVQSVDGFPAGEKKWNADPFQVESYLRHQGNTFLQRDFDAKSYVVLTDQMDTHDLARNRGEYVEVLGSMKKPCCVVGISSDVLYPPVEQEELHELLPNSELHIIDSYEGHDGFLLEQAHIGPIVQNFLAKIETGAWAGTAAADDADPVI
jgi:homoserine O-acetyltransferase